MRAKKYLMGLLPAFMLAVLAGATMLGSWLATADNAWGMTMTQTECHRCHGTDDTAIVAFHHGVRDANNWSCTQCHKPVSDGTGGYTIVVEKNCTVCHGPGYHTEPAGTNRDRHHNIRNANDFGCLHCHPAVQDETGNTTIVLSRDCFFCHVDGQKQWREVKWLTELPSTTAPDSAATGTDITSKFHDTMMYESYEVVNTSTVDKALSVRLDKDAVTASKVTLRFYVFELPSSQATIRIYPYLFDGETVDTSVWKDFRIGSANAWTQCDVTSLAAKMSGFTWMKFRVTVLNGPVFLSEGDFEIIRKTTDGSTTNLVPIPSAGPDQITYVNYTANFSADGSTDPDGTIASYVWNFGDGTIGTGPNVSHVYTIGGVYLVSLTVTDNLGAIAEDFAFFNVRTSSLPPNEPPVANAGPDIVAMTGKPVTLSAAGSSDPDGQIYSWTWSFDDGTSASGEAVTKVYQSPGTYVATLTVIDNQKAISTDTAVIIVQAPPTGNAAPVASAGPDTYASVGEPLVFNGSASSDSDGTIVSYAWDFGDGTSGTGVSPTKTYTKDGIYVVTLIVTDNAGARGIDAVLITIHPPIAQNKPPVAAAGPDVTVTALQNITFSAAGSADGDGTIASYSWNFGDGTYATGMTVTKAYTNAGTFTAALIVTDNKGATGTDTAVVTVTAAPQNVGPTANAGSDVTATAGQAITFSGAGSSDPDGTISSYSWNFGDGTSATGLSATKSYAAAGTYTVTLTVTDNAGATATDTAVVTIPIVNRAPVANAGPDVTAVAGVAVSFSGAGSYDPDGPIASYRWSLGDGTTKTGATVTKTYSTAGTYTIKLTVTDNSGATATDSAIVTVTAPATNLAPVANAGPDVSGTVGQVVNFACTGSSDKDGTITNYLWSFGDGSTKSGCNVTKNYTSAGKYTVSLTVTDNFGATGTDTAVAMIAARGRR